MEEELIQLQQREQELEEELARVRKRISELKTKQQSANVTHSSNDLYSIEDIQALMQTVAAAKTNRATLKPIEDDAERIGLCLNAIAADVDHQPRQLRVAAIQAILVLSEEIPKVLATVTENDALTKWVYLDIQTEGDDELVYLALLCLTAICFQKNLPSSVRDKLGANLMEFLIDLAAQRCEDEEDAIGNAALKSLISVNTQFDRADLIENRVVNKLVFHTSASILGQQFIRLLNREEDTNVMLPAMLKLFTDIFSVEKSAKEFFYTNDLYVLVDVILRELMDLPEDATPLRLKYLDLLHQLLPNSNYRSLLYRKDDVVDVLDVMGHYKDITVSQKAAAILFDCEFLRK